MTDSDFFEKKREKIVADYPRLFRYRQYFACGDGWLDIIERLATKLESMILAFKQRNPDIADDELPCCSDVKQKWGELRFYMHSETDEMSHAIREAQEESVRTCEICGLPGKYTSHLILVACEKCEQKHSKMR